jgi:hypothetical protein
MVKNKSSTKTKSKQTRAQPQSRKTVTRTRTISSNPSPLRDVRAFRWDQLLRDPCSASLAAPCYGGSDTGYLVRTTDLFQPSIGLSGATPGATYFGTASIQFTPGNASLSTGLVVSNTAGTVSSAGVANFITSSTSVKRYRPVACCLKYLPIGAYSTRAGVIGLGYSSGQIETSGDSVLPYDLLKSSQHQSPIGSEAHEVRWLPTTIDEVFTTTSAPNVVGAGTVYCALYGVDAIATSSTAGNVNGFVELTTVWEWIPIAANGLVISPQAPPPYTSQQILSTISDMGSYLFRGIRRNAGNGMMIAGQRTVQQLLSRGAGVSSTRGPSYPLLM